MIETSFTIKQVSVDEALKEAEAKAERTSKNIDNSLNGNGAKKASESIEKMSRGLESVNKLGGKTGGFLKNITDAVKGMLSPIGLVTAAFGFLTAAIVEAWNKAKIKLEEAKKSYQWELTQASENTVSIDARQKTDDGYMQRLIEINNMENIDNATKIEAMRIINNLSSQYGNLGLSIDATTGKIEGLTGAINKQKELMRQEKISSLEAELSKLEGLEMVYEKKAFDKSIFRSKDENMIENFAPFSEQEKAILNAFLNDQGSIGKAFEMQQKQLEKAYNNYLQAFGKNADFSEIPKDFVPELEPSPEVKKIQEEARNLTEYALTVPEEKRWEIDEQLKYLGMMQDVQMKIDATYKLQADENMSSEQRENFRKMYENAKQYMAVLVKIRNLYRGTTSLSDGEFAVLRGKNSMAKSQSDSAVKMAEQAGAKQKFDSMTPEEKKDAIFEGITKLGEEKTRLEMEERMAENALISAEIEAKVAKNKASYGKFNTLSDEQDFIRLEKKRIELETEYYNRKKNTADITRQIIELENQYNQYNKQNAGNEDEIKARTELDWLMKTAVPNGVGIKTDSLRQRGGYMSGVNLATTSINQRILQGVSTANQLLTAIKTGVYEGVVI